ncbi:hypothetical protein TrLO_g13660 [Triparma laevis f. longispina]|uniref:CS domain-containing protein n=1 Tax=Triparma laevis f. longispina TaxID=1714387 RepID=A0A9W7A424_9STRA|nr:hypothetical protein TrLO_g13660 [Triparma laevis f. longispina]
MSGFNYSKWDNLDCSSSEDEADEPSVTRFDNSSSVTFGGGRDGILIDEQSQSQSQSTTALKGAAPAATQAAAPASAPTVVPPPKPKPTEPPTSNGSTFTTPSNQTISFSQIRETLTLSLLIPSTTKSPTLTVTLKDAFTFKDRNAAVGKAKCSLLVSLEGEEILNDVLMHNVYHGDSDDPDLELLTPDWELKTYGSSKYLQITLQKAVPMSGVVIWWTRVFRDYGDDIVVEREDKNGMKEAWEEAHRMFKEKVGGRAKEEVFF